MERVVIVTGAASGIGLAVAKKFTEENAKVLMADVNEEKLIRENCVWKDRAQTPKWSQN